MESLPMNPADLAVLGVLLLAALLAFSRGLVAEVLSLVAWSGAGLITLYALPVVLPLVEPHIKVPMIAYAVSAVGVFVVALVVLSVVGNQVSRGVQNSSLSAVDRSLGFVFGLGKGAILASVAYLFFIWLVPPAEHPAWLKEARTRPLLEEGAALIVELVPERLRNEGLAQMDLVRDRAQQAAEAKQQLDRLSSPVPTPPKTGAPEGDKGYNRSERGTLDQLFQQNTAAPRN